MTGAIRPFPMADTVALGEVQALVAKAAWGASRAPGVAEDAGRAARWLSERGWDGAGALARLLVATDGVPHGALVPILPGLSPAGRVICPLILGAYLSDLGHLPEGPIGPVIEPLILAPFLAHLAGEGEIALAVGEVEVSIHADALSGYPVSHDPAMVLIAWDAASRPALAARRAIRATLSRETAAILSALAARTYAPATDASRTAGAGAGISDDD